MDKLTQTKEGHSSYFLNVLAEIRTRFNIGPLFQSRGEKNELLPENVTHHITVIHQGQLLIH